MGEAEKPQVGTGTDTPDDGGRWAITVTVPSSLDEAAQEALFDAVVEAVEKWEPEHRDGWDADVSAGPHRPETEEDGRS